MSAPTRRSIPETLPLAARFSDDGTLANNFTLIAMVKGMPSIHRDLEVACQRAYRWGPDRMAGHWHLVYLCFVISRIPDIQPWYQRIGSDEEFWRACGFERIPSYRTVHLRLTGLGDAAADFEHAAGELIRAARRRDPRVGAWWHVDATEAETHAAPQHDCQPGETCHRRANLVPHLTRPSTDVVRAIRHGEAALPEDGAGVPVVRDGYQPTLIPNQYVDPARRGKRLRLGDHWWFSRDPDAGTRAYTRGLLVKRVWHGYLQVEVVDHFTAATLYSRLIPADQQESSAYPEIFDGALAQVGALPLAVAGDRGLSFASNFLMNSRHGVASVFPYRRRNGADPVQRTGTARYDEHGVPKCKGCGGETRFHSFAVDRNRPRVWFVCKLPTSPSCDGRQSISCEEEPRYLLPLWRTEAAYAALRVSHQSYEHKHRSMRIQYLVGPDCLALRPKRPGMVWQQLRAHAATVIEWLRVLQRAGWDDHTPAVTLSPRRTSGGTMTERLLGSRARRRSAAATDVPMRAATPPAPPPDIGA